MGKYGEMWNKFLSPHSHLQSHAWLKQPEERPDERRMYSEVVNKWGENWTLLAILKVSSIICGWSVVCTVVILNLIKKAYLYPRAQPASVLSPICLHGKHHNVWFLPEKTGCWHSKSALSLGASLFHTLIWNSGLQKVIRIPKVLMTHRATRITFPPFNRGLLRSFKTFLKNWNIIETSFCLFSFAHACRRLAQETCTNVHRGKTQHRGTKCFLCAPSPYRAAWRRYMGSTLWNVYWFRYVDLNVVSHREWEDLDLLDRMVVWNW